MDKTSRNVIGPCYVGVWTKTRRKQFTYGLLGHQE